MKLILLMVQRFLNLSFRKRKSKRKIEARSSQQGSPDVNLFSCFFRPLTLPNKKASEVLLPFFKLKRNKKTYLTSDTTEHKVTNQQKHVLPRRKHFGLMFQVITTPQSEESNVKDLTLLYLQWKRHDCRISNSCRQTLLVHVQGSPQSRLWLHSHLPTYTTIIIYQCFSVKQTNWDFARSTGNDTIQKKREVNIKKNNTQQPCFDRNSNI